MARKMNPIRLPLAKTEAKTPSISRMVSISLQLEFNESMLLFSNTVIGMNMLEAARRNKVKNFFYPSSACVYNEAKQEDPDNPESIESDACLSSRYLRS